jgi:hypothetical protein
MVSNQLGPTVYLEGLVPRSSALRYNENTVTNYVIYLNQPRSYFAFREVLMTRQTVSVSRTKRPHCPRALNLKSAR